MSISHEMTDVAGERARFQERQRREREENRPATVLRLSPPGASLDDLRAVVDTHYAKLSPTEREDLVRRVQERQAHVRGVRLDPEAVAVQPLDYTPKGKGRVPGRRSTIPDLTAWGTDASPAVEADHETNDPPATPPAAEPESTMPGDTKRRLSEEDRRRVVEHAARELRENPSTSVSKLMKAVREDLGVQMSDATFYTVYLPRARHAAGLSPKAKGPAKRVAAPAGPQPTPAPAPTVEPSGVTAAERSTERPPHLNGNGRPAPATPVERQPVLADMNPAERPAFLLYRTERGKMRVFLDIEVSLSDALGLAGSIKAFAGDQLREVAHG